MSKIAILTETSSDLTSKQQAHPRIYEIPLYILFGEESFKENEEISHQEFYQRLSEEDNLPTTSQPTPGDFMAKFDQMLADGYDEIIVITMSDNLSGTGQSARLAASDYADQVHVFNSKQATVATGLLVYEAALMADQAYSAEDILARLAEMDEQVMTVAMIVNLENLVKGGRLPKIADTVVSWFGLKFMVSLIDGQVSLDKQVRTEKRGFQAMIDRLGKYLQEHEGPFQATAFHADAPDKGQAFLEEVNQAFPDLDVELGSFGPVIGTHAGPGTVGIVCVQAPLSAAKK